MRNEQQGSVERLQRGLQRLAALDVEVVGRLVEDEEVRARGDEKREGQPPPLPSREHADGFLLRVVAGEEEASQQLLGIGARKPGRRARAVDHAAAIVQLEGVLGEIAALHALTEAHGSRRRRAATDQRLDQGGLARAVRSDQGDVLAALQHEIDAAEEPAATDFERKPLGLQHDPSRAGGFQELEPE